MFSLKIRYTLYGMIISASLITIVAQASTVDGVFGTYFQNMVGICSTSNAEVITGFDNSPSLLFGQKVCTKVKDLLATIGIDVTGGNVGIGTVGPLTARLEVAGQVKITGGTPGLNKVLTSDADGLATWSGGGVSLPCVPGGTGPNNICHGSNALVSNAIGHENIAMGDNALQSNTDGYHNTAVGYAALTSNINGAENTAIGLGALFTSEGTFNTAIGKGSLLNLFSGNYNTAIGGAAGSNLVLGTNNIAIGYGTDFVDINGSNQLNIGNIIFGTGLTGTVGAPVGNIGIGTSTPTAKLEVAGNIIAATPTAPNHLTTKGYVDSMSHSLRSLPILSGATVGLKPVSSGEFLFPDLAKATGGCVIHETHSVNNTIFLTTGCGPNMYFSTDNGVTWGKNGVGNFYNVAYGAGRYVFTPWPHTDKGGYTNSLTLPTTTITNTTLPFSAVYNGIAYGAGRFVVVAQGHTPINSTDGITWNDPSTGPTISGNQNIIWMPSASLFIIKSYSSNIYHTSPDGINWVLRNAPMTFSWHRGVYMNGAYYASEDGTRNLYKTTDGISWVLAGVGPTSYPPDLTYYNGVYIANGAHNIFTSTDLNKWTVRDYTAGNITGIVSTDDRAFFTDNYVNMGSNTVEGVFY